MKLTQIELEKIRFNRIDEYENSVSKHIKNRRAYRYTDDLYNELKIIRLSIIEVENELDLNFPNWDT